MHLESCLMLEHMCSQHLNEAPLSKWQEMDFFKLYCYNLIIFFFKKFIEVTFVYNII